MNTFHTEFSKKSQALLEKSRQRATSTKSQAWMCSPKEFNWTYAFFELYKDEPLRLRQALSFAYALNNEPALIFDGFELVGQFYRIQGLGTPDANGHGIWEEHAAASVAERRCESELPDLIALSNQPGGKAWVDMSACTFGHTAWHWEWILESGVEGLLKRIAQSPAAKNPEKRHLLDGMKICLEALLEWNDRHVAALEEKLARGTDANLSEELRRKLEICRNVPRRGSKTFREAVQAFHFSYLATMYENPYGGNGPGRLDYFLWPFLEKDLKAGIEKLQSARELIDELFVRFHERHGFTGETAVETIVVGGSHPDGTSSINPLSYMMVESISDLKIGHPSVYMRMPENPPEEYLDLAAHDLAVGNNRGQIISDKAIVEASLDWGIPEEDARMYVCGGCMEIFPHGMNGDLLMTGWFNTPMLLELVLNGGRSLIDARQMLPHYHKELPDFPTFEAFYEAFEAELRTALYLTFRKIDIAAEEAARLRPAFLLSSQIDDCIGRGLPINGGGAKYEDFGTTPLGIPNLADRLTALAIAVYEEKFLSATELLEALHCDFEGLEPLRRRLASLPKFGQGNAVADAMAKRVCTTICNIYASYTNRLGGRVKPMVMTFTMAAPTGASLGAAPDGSKAGIPIAQGLTPQSCAMKDGITPAILSANTLPLRLFSGGASTMWDLDPALATPETLKSLVKTFIATGGQIYQGNTTSVEELENALAEPEKYPNLMVRVGGFSSRFVALKPDVQREVVQRHRHSH